MAPKKDKLLYLPSESCEETRHQRKRNKRLYVGALYTVVSTAGGLLGGYILAGLWIIFSYWDLSVDPNTLSVIYAAFLILGGGPNLALGIFLTRKSLQSFDQRQRECVWRQRKTQLKKATKDQETQTKTVEEKVNRPKKPVCKAKMVLKDNEMVI